MGLTVERRSAYRKKRPRRAMVMMMLYPWREGRTASSFRALAEVIAEHGCSASSAPLQKRSAEPDHIPQVFHSSALGGQSARGRFIAGGGVWPKLPG
jgi:hypothetical protein